MWFHEEKQNELENAAEERCVQPRNSSCLEQCSGSPGMQQVKGGGKSKQSLPVLVRK